MKKFFILLFALILGTNVFAQVGGVVYDPFIPGQSRSTTQKPNNQIYSTTAYRYNSYGKLESMQIKVEVTQSGASYGTSASVRMNVIAIYSKSGLTGGYWQETPTRPTVYQCSPYSNNYLEQQFMYKTMAGSNGYVYFNL